MSREKSLLERLREPDAQPGRSIHENTNRLAESVMANLRHLLNSRHGITPIRADYGIPDLSDVIHDFPDAIAAMRKAIKAAIEEYEPRLRRVTIKHVAAPEDPLGLHFEITGELVTEGERASVWIETRIDGSGAVQVRG